VPENGVLLLVWVPFYTVSSSISRSAYSKQENRRASARCPGTQPTPCGSQNCLALLAISSTALACSETRAFFTAALRKPRENVREEGGGESAGREVFGQNFCAERVRANTFMVIFFVELIRGCDQIFCFGSPRNSNK
jgi:hypothetical protein